MICSDEQRIMQVLLGLQSNALKFTRTGMVSIHVDIIDEDGAQYLKIKVIDTGVGIPYEEQEKLFKLFGFVASTQHVNKSGIGLGLVISKSIVKEFDGDINFISCPKKGSIFTFKFKLEEINKVSDVESN